MKLNEAFIEKLKNTKETGMGYHKVDIVLTSGETLSDIIVLNCELILNPSNLTLDQIEDIKV